MSSGSDNQSNFATVKTIISAAGSIAATAVVIRSVANEFLPYEFHNYLLSTAHSLFNRFSKDLTLVINEYEGWLIPNEVYNAAESYLGTKISPSTRRLTISRSVNGKDFNTGMVNGGEVVDLFRGETFKWVFVSEEVASNDDIYVHRSRSAMKSKVKSLELTFKKKNRELVFDSYLPHILDFAESLKQQKKILHIYTPDDCYWQSVTFEHPATFETLAMEPNEKDRILKDLDRFVRRKEYYKKVGKAWKRGYLLYGPPGTGKSSLIAAMANYLSFNVYDLELSQVKNNSDLRRLLMATANKSILVVEDIDCTIDLKKKLSKRTNSSPTSETDPQNDSNGNSDESKVTLSGLLNFVDGLWSTCGAERIIIFTTNHIEKLDPALLRPGRMDVHISMSYCTAGGFEVLAWNYLGIKDHPRFKEIIGLIQSVNVTPAEVAEQLLKNDDHDLVLQDLVDFIQRKSKEGKEDQAKVENVADSAE